MRLLRLVIVSTVLSLIGCITIPYVENVNNYTCSRFQEIKVSEYIKKCVKDSLGGQDQCWDNAVRANCDLKPEPKSKLNMGVVK